MFKKTAQLVRDGFPYQLVLYLGHYCFKLIAIFFNFNSTQRKFTETHILLFLCTSWKRLAACHAGSQILRCGRFSGVFLLRKLLAGRSPHLLLPATCAACFFSGEKCELRRGVCVRQCADVSTKATPAARQLGASPAAANRQLDTQRPDCWNIFLAGKKSDREKRQKAKILEK